MDGYGKNIKKKHKVSLTHKNRQKQKQKQKFFVTQNILSCSASSTTHFRSHSVFKKVFKILLNYLPGQFTYV